MLLDGGIDLVRVLVCWFGSFGLFAYVGLVFIVGGFAYLLWSDVCVMFVGLWCLLFVLVTLLLLLVV